MKDVVFEMQKHFIEGELEKYLKTICDICEPETSVKENLLRDFLRPVFMKGILVGIDSVRMENSEYKRIYERGVEFGRPPTKIIKSLFTFMDDVPVGTMAFALFLTMPEDEELKKRMIELNKVGKKIGYEVRFYEEKEIIKQ